MEQMEYQRGTSSKQIVNLSNQMRSDDPLAAVKWRYASFRAFPSAQGSQTVAEHVNTLSTNVRGTPIGKQLAMKWAGLVSLQHPFFLTWSLFAWQFARGADRRLPPLFVRLPWCRSWWTRLSIRLSPNVTFLYPSLLVASFFPLVLGTVTLFSCFSSASFLLFLSLEQ